MDAQSLSWRARLAKANINILQVTPHYWVVEFTYHPKPGTFKWCKTLFTPPLPSYAPAASTPSASSAPTYEECGEKLLEDVLALRKELEG